MGRKITKPEKVEYYVYIGPTIRSAVQQNTIITGSREVVKKKLAGAIEKYPPIEQLIVNGEELAEARKQIKQPGNRMYEVCKRLTGLLKTNGG